MTPRSVWSQRLRVARLIQRRDTRSALLGLSVYVVLAATVVATALVLRNYLQFARDSGLIVIVQPYRLPFLSFMFIFSILLALFSVTSIAREKDLGTLQVLFYGPIDTVAYVLGKYAAQLVLYLLAMAAYLGFLVLYAWVSNILLPRHLVWLALLSVLTASGVVSFGIFLSTLTASVRSALALFLGVILVFGVILIGHEILDSVPPTGRYYNPIVFARNVFYGLSLTANALSPLSYLNQGMEAVLQGSLTGYLVILAASLAYGPIFLALGMATLERRGVRR